MFMFVVVKTTPQDIRIPVFRRLAGSDFVQTRKCDTNMRRSRAQPLHPATVSIGANDSKASSTQRIVLQTLVEKFGGEVARSTLDLHLAQMAGRRTLMLDECLSDALFALERCGALTVDAVDGTEVILRLTQSGAALLDDMSTARALIHHFPNGKTSDESATRLGPDTQS